MVDNHTGMGGSQIHSSLVYMQGLNILKKLYTRHSGKLCGMKNGSKERHRSLFCSSIRHTWKGLDAPTVWPWVLSKLYTFRITQEEFVQCSTSQSGPSYWYITTLLPLVCSASVTALIIIFWKPLSSIDKLELPYRYFSSHLEEEWPTLSVGRY